MYYIVQYLHWGAGISINLFLTIIIVVHGVRYRLIDDKLNTLDDLDNVSSSQQEEEQLPNQSISPYIDNNVTNIDNEYNPNVISIVGEEQELKSIQTTHNVSAIPNHMIVSSSTLSMTPSSTPILGETEHLTQNSGNSMNMMNMESNTINNTNDNEIEDLTRQRSKKVILRKDELHHQIEYSIIDGPPPPPTIHDNNQHDNEKKSKNRTISKYNIIEKYFKSIQYGITSRFIIFITYLIVSMIVTVVLTSFFYGSCICVNEFEFSTTFTRYVQSREGQTICSSESICSLTLLLGEKPQNEMIVKYFTQSRPISSFIMLNGTMLPCYYQDLNEIETELIQRYVHTCKLNNLNHDSIYKFQVGYKITINGSDFMSPFKQFKTFSNSNTNVNFIQTSEFGYNDIAFNLLNQSIIRNNPKFISISGNIVYDNGFLTCYSRWVQFLHRYSTIAIDSNSNMIPLLTSIGNYEALFWKFKANFERDVRPYKYFMLSNVNNTMLNTSSLYHYHYLLNNVSTQCSLLSLDSHVVNSHQSQVDFINHFYGNQIEKFRMVMYSMPLFPSLTDMGMFIYI